MNRRATTSVLNAAALSVLAAAAVAQQAPAPRHIRGRVLNGEGAPVAGAEVCARPRDSIRGPLPCAPSDARGRFSIPVEFSETYYLTAGSEAEGYPNYYRPFYRAPFMDVPEVIVADGQEPTEVTLQLGFRAARLTLKVSDEATGLPVRDARVRLCRLETPRYCASFDRAQTADGYRLLAPASPVTVEVTADGYDEWDSAGPLRLEAGAAGELEAALRKTRPGGALRPALPAPAQTSPADAAVFDHYPRAAVLEWQPVHGAASYAVEVEYFTRCHGFPCAEPTPETIPHQLNGDPPQSGIEATRYEFNFIGAQSGRWRVRAFDAKGRGGARSPWRTFTYKI